MYETFEHTADLGLRVRADSLNGLFAEAGKGFLSILLDNPDAVRPVREIPLLIDGTELDYLFFDWLNELLVRFETDEMLFCGFTVEVGETGLQARIRGEQVDRSRHQLAHEVKAITYHQLTVQKTDGEWLAEVILDI